ncbi:glucan endo-1,3-beta-glucosidase 13 [Nymphaea colorata]|nr:glucan endo-1,3-beta-glucosidase 13 [Nymphaea colorata]
MNKKNAHFFLPLVLVLLTATISGQKSVFARIPIGVNYAKHAHGGNPSPAAVISALRSMRIDRVRLLVPDLDLIQAFSYTGISLLLCLHNSYVPRFASNESEAYTWVRDHVASRYPRIRVVMLSLGSNVLTLSPDLAEFVLPAVQNVHRALRKLGLRHVSVSTTASFEALTSAFPPSGAQFHQFAAQSFFAPLLDFLSATNSSFLVDICPYDLFRTDPEIPIGFALFQEEPFSFRDDPVTGIRYRNLFDVMVDAVINGMAALGHDDIPVVVTETGWPSSGGPGEPEASLVYAEMYNRGLVRHLAESVSRTASPTRRDAVPETYIYLQDEDAKQGRGAEARWGILYPNLTKKYEFDLSRGARAADSCAVAAVTAAALLLFRRSFFFF